MPKKTAKKPVRSASITKPARSGRSHKNNTALPGKSGPPSGAKKSVVPAKPVRLVQAVKPSKNKSPRETVGSQGRSVIATVPAAPPVVIPRPVPTDGKPRKNQAGMNLRELEHYRELLLQKRRELVGDMSSMEREALRSTTGTNLSSLPLHMADMGTDNYEQEFTLGLVEKDRQLLREINRALAKIMDGTYGICEGTGKPISKPRLEAQPWAKYSIEYARQLERGMLRR